MNLIKKKYFYKATYVLTLIALVAILILQDRKLQVKPSIDPASSQATTLASKSRSETMEPHNRPTPLRSQPVCTAFKIQNDPTDATLWTKTIECESPLGGSYKLIAVNLKNDIFKKYEELFNKNPRSFRESIVFPTFFQNLKDTNFEYHAAFISQKIGDKEIMLYGNNFQKTYKNNPPANTSRTLKYYAYFLGASFLLIHSITCPPDTEDCIFLAKNSLESITVYIVTSLVP